MVRRFTESGNDISNTPSRAPAVMSTFPTPKGLLICALSRRRDTLCRSPVFENAADRNRFFLWDAMVPRSSAITAAGSSHRRPASSSPTTTGPPRVKSATVPLRTIRYCTGKFLKAGSSFPPPAGEGGAAGRCSVSGGPGAAAGVCDRRISSDGEIRIILLMLAPKLPRVAMSFHSENAILMSRMLTL